RERDRAALVHLVGARRAGRRLEAHERVAHAVVGEKDAPGPMDGDRARRVELDRVLEGRQRIPSVRRALFDEAERRERPCAFAPGAEQERALELVDARGLAREAPRLVELLRGEVEERELRARRDVPRAGLEDRFELGLERLGVSVAGEERARLTVE